MPDVPMVKFEHVSMEYKKGGRLALEDIDFQADPGEFVFLLGHSGAGKSTLLKLILREIVPHRGQGLCQRQRRGGFAPAQDPLYPPTLR